MTETRVCVLVLAGGAGWEAGVLQALADAGVVVARRCVDVPDLMASAATAGARVAVVAGELPHLDAEAVMHLLRYDVRTLGVADRTDVADRLGRLGVVEVVPPVAADVVAAVERVATHDVVADPDPVGRHAERASGEGHGRVLAVWGPAGAPGRTTVAVDLAAALASAGTTVVLVDADPYGGTVAQQLGVLDEIPGLLAVARMANLGTLDEDAFVRACRRVGERFDVLTGLPRADRRVEIRPDVLGRVLEVAAGLGDVVVDCGFCLEDAELPHARDRMTLDALAAADEILVVGGGGAPGRPHRAPPPRPHARALTPPPAPPAAAEILAVGSAEPSGLTRLARGLVDLQALAVGAPVRVVVNRMRASLGWSEREIAGMVEGYTRPLSVHFLPDDRESVDRALVTGRTLTELGESPLRAAIADLARAVQQAGTPARERQRPRRGRRVAG